ncbi:MULTISPECIES: endonuclease domain-containing protein [unclassified Leifsonia]|uniref:endonuclease domain-containing protein n=1 Tax=unclassified Leifsonia TaxID=2663824 RepID=UPI0006FC6C92|nr:MULTISPECIES: DUF559 domain-containing protein [unclassified Leifsonia]KQX05354.1 hypothetical protein ASC59_14465 [Leifsonia sp. Root1293]KRA08986.1 hypothetical protein ASD61_14460 [Leifsonia sp. Root60]
MSIAEVLDRSGGVASYRTLDSRGVGRSSVRAAVRSGQIIQVRGRWFASPSAATDVVRAVRVGGTLTGSSAARLQGMWTLDDDRLHVRVPTTASRLRSPADRGMPLDAAHDRVCVHYSRRPGTEHAMDGVLDALVEMYSCGDARAAVVATDSALNQGLLSVAELSELRTLIPADRRKFVDRVDGKAQSGLETLARLLLRARRIRFRTQVWIAPAGRVDILVGDRLVLELDGRAFHTGAAFEEDRRRDLELVMQGYLVVRISYRMVMARWDDVAAAILELVRRDEHLWGGRRPSAPVPFTYTGSAPR